MKLESGKQYRNRRGDVVTISARLCYGRYVLFPHFPFQDQNGDIYMENGKFIASTSILHSKDIVSIV